MMLLQVGLDVSGLVAGEAREEEELASGPSRPASLGGPTNRGLPVLIGGVLVPQESRHGRMTLQKLTTPGSPFSVSVKPQPPST